jgi:hypothetical protein
MICTQWNPPGHEYPKLLNPHVYYTEVTARSVKLYSHTVVSVAVRNQEVKCDVPAKSHFRQLCHRAIELAGPRRAKRTIFDVWSGVPFLLWRALASAVVLRNSVIPAGGLVKTSESPDRLRLKTNSGVSPFL